MIEKTLLINLYYDNKQEEESKNDLKELILLADTSGCKIIKSLNLLLKKIDPATFLTKGRLEEARSFKESLGIDVIIINCELKPGQVRNLEDYFGIKVIGRPELIFDIFAQRARTRESKIQVELAQIKYLATRLTGRGVMMSQLGGGIGTRGPGEKRLEYDRRHIEKRIHTLQEELKSIEKHRARLTQNRKEKVIGLVGYTNAGKSTLLNALAKENLKTENRLFVTLDSTIRQVYLAAGKCVLMFDTVGFIKNLPHYLVASFRSTLEEIRDADLILHVIDSGDKNYEEKIDVVDNVLQETGIDPLKSILVFNKTDNLNILEIRKIERDYPRGLMISAKEKTNLEKLKEYILFKTGIAEGGV